MYELKKEVFMKISAVNNYQAQNKNQYKNQNTSFRAFRATENDTLTINKLIKDKLSWLKEALTSRRIMDLAEELFGKKDERTEDLRKTESILYPQNYYCHIPKIQEEQIKSLPAEKQIGAIIKAISISDPVSPRDVLNQSTLYNGKSIAAEREVEKVIVTDEMFDLLVQAKDLKAL